MSIQTNIALAPFTSVDIPRLVSWVGNPDDLLRWAGPTLHWPLTVDQLDKHLNTIADSDGRHFWFKAEHNKRDPYVGAIEVAAIDYDHGNALISRVAVSPDQRGRGYGELMMREALRFCFEELNLHRVSLFVFDFNSAAIRCYEKVGFIREGVQRESRRSESGSFWNAMGMGILEDEWRQLQSAC